MKKEELLALFFTEVEENMENLEQGILKLEEDHDDKEIIQDIFRFAHSIKGASASMGFNVLKELTHQMEFILDLIRKEKLVATQKVVDVLFECLDVLHILKENYQNGEEPTNIEGIVAKLKALQVDNQQDVNTTATAQVNIPSEVKEVLTKGEEVWVTKVTFTLTCATKTIRSHIVKKEVEKLGKLLHVDLSQVENPTIRTSSFYFQKEVDTFDTQKERIEKIIDVEQVIIEQVTIEKEPETPKKTERSEKPAKKATNPTIRVDVSKIETLMNLVGEIIIDQTMVMKLNQDMKQQGTSHEDVAEQERILKHMARVVSEFQESVMKTRMLPIEQLFGRFPRIIRDLSNQLGKDIHLVMEGGETEIDRTVIEEITDPMIHIIRNSVDHGIEPDDVRREVGKGQGVVTITAAHKENQVILTVHDDGAGIDPEKMKIVGVKKGLITEAQAQTMSDKELVNLILAPGFSTAEKVSDVSGRGVGMDVVRTHIEKLNGLFEIETEKGKGTSMIIKLPLTLAILKGFLVEIQERTFAIPMGNVTEIFKIRESDIQTINGQSMVKLRDETLPLVYGHDVFHFEKQDEKPKKMIVMIIGLAEKRIGLIIDKLIGNQEIVVKPLGSYVGKVPAVSGSTILGDGTVSLILDIADIFSMYEAQKVGMQDD